MSVCCSLLVAASAANAQEIPTYAPPPAMPADAASLPRIVLMSMGGTIASRGTPRTNITAYGGKGSIRVEPIDWVNDLPELAGIARITVEDQRSPVDRPSGQETHEDLARVSKRLNELALDPNVDGVVITHGTNTQSEVAYFMTLTVKTVFLAASNQRKPCEMKQLFGEAVFREYMAKVILDATAPALPAQPWLSFFCNQCSDFRSRADRIIERYATVLDPEALQMVHKLHANTWNSAEILTVVGEARRAGSTQFISLGSLFGYSAEAVAALFALVAWREKERLRLSPILKLDLGIAIDDESYFQR